jgi:biotin carboxylase
MTKRILLVHNYGGPPPGYALPRIAARGQVEILALRPLPAATEHLWRPYCAAVIPAYEDRIEGDALTDLIVEQARRIGADAVCTMSEFAVIAVAQAAERLGLPGAGPEVARSRDKRLMRSTWEAAGVPSPRFRAVSSEDEVRTAFHELTPPLLLKSAWGAGSLAQLVIDREDRIGPAWAQSTAAMAEADATGVITLTEPGARVGFLVEEIIPGTTRSWWEDGSGYGDYLSVEGIVVEGEYHPVCITSRLPTIPPFTELCNIAPCVLPGHLQREVESVARAAVGALGLRTCGTHTELKLMADGRLAVIESAARFGGAMIAAQIERVYGYDLIGMLADALLGLPPGLPERMQTDRDARGAACSLSLLATNAAGVPWRRDLVWDESLVDWSTMLTPGTSVEAVPGQTIPDGTPMPRYELSSGLMALGGVLYLRAADAGTLVRDAYAVLNGLESALANGWREKNTREKNATAEVGP